MDEFLRVACADLGIGEHVAREAAAEILLVLRGRMAPDDFGRLTRAVPSAADLLTARTGPLPAKGIAGQLQKAASLLGNQPGALDATGLARRCGLASDSIGPFVALFLAFVAGSVDETLFARVRQSAPELVSLSRRG